MSIIRDEHAAAPGLAIIDKYEEAVTYLYPILQRCPRAHGNVRDTMMAVLFDQVGLFYQAAKSRQPSKLYAADANLATLRFWLRFAADRKLKIITPNQHKATLRLLAEAGAMLGAWIKSAKGNG
ncbi:MAG: diversity-generating retroelement protein Avd [Mesorhizobium sp.]|uniref:diversity-generating retroelement protein Avd n=1 Tax=Mesorhizobium sp. M7A.F.Ca.ET.027.02.1.1 TaxID=2496655 RepID=UPI000FD5BA43|nr:diversity-generating retroelement protein Avd [Mesorhizobium sp. M7A.F.Ca.ET.027.02.1.1]RVD18432.1 diversity-generating retroelement protein Avd [Mesorhizobium sp. M7A.F.Ca.ET.027.02.1.1]RWC99170.1 MAG: diversity-generating retroelement protein Avd [Mesorhizobium sp.]